MSEYKSAELTRREYTEKKERIISLLDRTIEFYNGEGDDSNAEAFTSIKNNLINGEFSIVVVGEFSAGKSSLLNSLMGAKILPSFHDETTATVNFLKHRDKAQNGEAGKVYYYNGTETEIDSLDIDTISRYVTTKGDDVAKKIEHLDLFLDSEFLEDGVVLVDSPGLNGIKEGHAEITEQQIKKSHASIFLFSCDHPGSKSDFDFLDDLRGKVNTIILVLNKIDLIHDDEGETVEGVIENLKKNYKERFPDATTIPEIWPVSAGQSLKAKTDSKLSETEKTAIEEASRLGNFENRLLSFLTNGEKARAQMTAPVGKVIDLLKETRENLKSEIEVLDGKKDSGELQQQIDESQKIIDELESRIEANKSKVEEKVKGGFDEVINSLVAGIGKYKERQAEYIENCDDLEELAEYAESFSTDFMRKANSILSDCDEELHQKIITIFRMVYSGEAKNISGQEFESSKAELEYDGHLDISPDNFSVGLEAMDKKIEAYQKEYEELSKQVDKAEEDVIKARNAQKAKDEIRQKISDAEDVKREIKGRFIPQVEYHNEHKYEKVNRGGLFGGIAFLFAGRKTIEYDEQVMDDSERKRVQQSIKNDIEEYDGKIAEYNDDLRRISGEDPEIALQRQRKIEALKNGKQDEIVELRKKNKEYIDSKYKKEIRKLKRQIGYFCDDMEENIRNNAKKILSDNKETYINTVLMLVESNLKKQMDDRIKRCEELKAQVNDSQEKKAAKLTEINDKIDNIDSILSDAIDISTDLSSLEVDHIKEVAI